LQSKLTKAVIQITTTNTRLAIFPIRSVIKLLEVVFTIYHPMFTFELPIYIFPRLSNSYLTNKIKGKKYMK